MKKIVLIFSCLFFNFMLEAKVIIMRHGQAEHNLTGCFNSNPNHPNYRPANLTALGIEQVRRTCKALQEFNVKPDNVDMVYVSPLPRTLQTAQIMVDEGIISQEQIIIDNRVEEHQIGDYEGRHHSQFPWWDGRGYEYQRWEHAKEYGGETELEIRERMVDVYQEVSKKDPNKYAIFITHGTPALQLMYALTGKREGVPTAGYKIVD